MAVSKHQTGALGLLQQAEHNNYRAKERTMTSMDTYMNEVRQGKLNEACEIVNTWYRVGNATGGYRWMRESLTKQSDHDLVKVLDEWWAIHPGNPAATAA